MEEVSEINLLRVSTVKPAMPTESKRMFLSAFDLMWRGLKSVERILFFKTSCNEFDETVERLKSSLSSILVHFYPLAGRLAFGDEQERLEIDCNDEGVLFFEASTNLHFHDLEISEFEFRPVFKRLVPALRHYQENELPLLSIQVTAFNGGGICIGTRLHHIVADGNSYWHFMQSWAECCRGVPISRYPEHKRDFFRHSNIIKNTSNIGAADRKCTFHESKEAQRKSCKTDGETQNLQPQMPGHQNESSETKLLDSNQMYKINEVDRPVEKGNQPKDLIYKTFHCSKEMIQKQKAQAEKNGNQAFSSFVTVAAHFWRCIVKARQIPDEWPVSMLLLVDVRNRANPPLSSAYFGNCVQITFANSTARELLSQIVSFACSLIKEAVNKCTEESLINVIKWEESNWRNKDRKKPEKDPMRERCTVHVVSSPRFPVYEVDYGWGRPVNVQAASMNEIGPMVLFPGRDGGGTMDISTCLPLSQMMSSIPCLLDL